jgi:hypothetical protein
VRVRLAIVGSFTGNAVPFDDNHGDCHVWCAATSNE